MVIARCKLFLRTVHNLWINSKETGYDVPRIPLPLPEMTKMTERPKMALVLGGGGVKGLAHVAVLEELEKANLPIDFIVGCSSGSIAGALYADSLDALKIKNILFKLKKRDLVNFNFLSSRYGLGKGDALRNVMRRYLSCPNFNELKIPLIVVATDLNVGELVTLHSGPIIPAVHASCAVPFYFKPVVLHDRVLVDGGVVNSVPTSVAKYHNPHLIVAVDLNQTLKHSLPAHLFGVAKRSWEIALYHQSRQCLNDAHIVIRPQMPLDIGIFDETYHELIYEAGRTAAKEVIPKIQQALKGYI